MLKDLKEALSSTRKADTTHVRMGFKRYVSRPCELGSVKYERSNFLRPTGEGQHDVPTSADFKRLRAYLRAAQDHIGEVLDSMERHQAQDPNLEDTGGMIRAAYAIDTDAPAGKPPSKLPHVAPACSSLMMAIEQAIDCGLLPPDPGRPWESEDEPEWLARFGYEPDMHADCEQCTGYPDDGPGWEMISDGVPVPVADLSAEQTLPADDGFVMREVSPGQFARVPLQKGNDHGQAR